MRSLRGLAFTAIWIPVAPCAWFNFPLYITALPCGWVPVDNRTPRNDRALTAALVRVLLGTLTPVRPRLLVPFLLVNPGTQAACARAAPLTVRYAPPFYATLPAAIPHLIYLPAYLT